MSYGQKDPTLDIKFHHLIILLFKEFFWNFVQIIL